MQAKADEQQPRDLRHDFVAVNVAVFGAFGEKLEDDLEQNSHHDEDANAVAVALVHFGQQMDDGKRQQKRTTKSKQQLEP